ncbi:hypothetical protein OY671_008963, partial [Metschnikowia pulcherrima]
GRDSRPGRRDGGALRPGRRAGRTARETADGRAPAPVAGGRDGAQARAADPGRTDLGRGPGGARQFSAPADRAGAARPGHHLHLDPLHERGAASRPHVADARGQGAGQRRARRDHADARRQDAGRGLHRLSDRRRGRHPAGPGPDRGGSARAGRRPGATGARDPRRQPAAHLQLHVARGAGTAPRPGARHAGAGRPASGHHLGVRAVGRQGAGRDGRRRGHSGLSEQAGRARRAAAP